MKASKHLIAACIALAVGFNPFTHAAASKSGSSTLPNQCNFTWILSESGSGADREAYCQIIAKNNCGDLQVKLYYKRSDRSNLVYGRDGYRRTSQAFVRRDNSGYNLTEARSCDFNASGANDSSRWGFRVNF